MIIIKFVFKYNSLCFIITDINDCNKKVLWKQSFHFVQFGELKKKKLSFSRTLRSYPIFIFLLFIIVFSLNN